MFATVVHAENDTAACQLLRGQLWTPSGSLTLKACADDVARRGEAQVGTGVRFGFWGQTLLAASKDGSFRSDNGGRDWVSLDVGCQKCGRPAPQLNLAGSSVPAAPGAASAAPAHPKPPEEFFQTATSRTPAPSSVAASASSASVRAALSGDGLADLSPRALADCELKRGQGWLAQPRQTLTQCLEALAKSTAAPDANGLQHAYWGGYYLAADRKTIYSSRDGDDWTRVRDR